MIKLQWSDQTYGFWRADVTVTSGQTSDWVMVNYNNSRTTVAVYPSGRAKAQYTVASEAEINAGTATWIDWPLGAANTARTDTLLGVATGIRLVSITGSAKMEILSI